VKRIQTEGFQPGPDAIANFEVAFECLERVYSQAIGGTLVLYALFMVTRRPMTVRHQNALFDAIAGFLGGVTGGAAAFPGMFVTIWCSFKGWSKERQRALYQPFILIVQFAAITLMTLPGFMPHNRHTFAFTGILFLPSVFLGSTLGMACFSR
jgi:hypothetical protein